MIPATGLQRTSWATRRVGWGVQDAVQDRARAFNLAVTSREAEDAPPVSAFGSVPAVIVARGWPVRVLLQNETVGGDERDVLIPTGATST